MFLKDTTKPLAHSANTDVRGNWEARVAELNALVDELKAEGLTVADAGMLALHQLDDLLDLADGWNRAIDTGRWARVA